MGELSHTWMETPVGVLLLVVRDEALETISFERNGSPMPAPDDSVRRDGHFARAKDQLSAYFDRQLRDFTLPLQPRGTRFQMRVWQELQSIPYGETRSYGELARAIGRPDAIRAVGAANGANPLPIVIPCHRVIGANGSLTGFGGGLPAKRLLLDLETYRANIIAFSGSRRRDR